MAERKLKKSELLNILSKDWDARRAKIALQRAKANKWTLEWLEREKTLERFLKEVGNPELAALIKRQAHFLGPGNKEKEEKNKKLK